MNDAWDVAHMELEMQDSLQLELLQTQLKRILILCTGIYKKQGTWRSSMMTSKIWYANSNFWSKTTSGNIIPCRIMQDYCINHPRPLQISSKKLERNRLFKQFMTVLYWIKKAVTLHKERYSEIAYELGFEKVQGFSRFFKKQVGISPTDFRYSL